MKQLLFASHDQLPGLSDARLLCVTAASKRSRYRVSASYLEIAPLHILTAGKSQLMRKLGLPRRDQDQMNPNGCRKTANPTSGPCRLKDELSVPDVK